MNGDFDEYFDDYYQEELDQLYKDAAHDAEYGRDEDGWIRITNFRQAQLPTYVQAVAAYHAEVGQTVLRVAEYGLQTSARRPGQVEKILDQGCLLKEPGYSEPNDMGLSRFWRILDDIEEKIQ